MSGQCCWPGKVVVNCGCNMYCLDSLIYRLISRSDGYNFLLPVVLVSVSSWCLLVDRSLYLSLLPLSC